MNDSFDWDQTDLLLLMVLGNRLGEIILNFGFSDEMELIVRLLLANRWMVVAKTSEG